MKRKYPNQGKLLRTLRSEAGLTQWQLAKALGFTTPQFVSNIERNTCHFPAKHVKKAVKIINKAMKATHCLEAQFGEAYVKDEWENWQREAKVKS